MNNKKLKSPVPLQCKHSWKWEEREENKIADCIFYNLDEMDNYIGRSCLPESYLRRDRLLSIRGDRKLKQAFFLSRKKYQKTQQNISPENLKVVFYQT